MKEEYVSYETAVALKAAGFDVLESDNAYYIHSWMQEPKLVPIEDAMFEESQYDGTEVYPAPTLSQAQRWLREVKGIHIILEPSRKGGQIFYLPYLTHEDFDEIVNIPRTDYDSALSAGIAKALEILNENKQ